MIIFLFCCLLFAFIVVAGVHHVLHIIPHPVAVSQAGLCCPLFPSISSFLISHWSAEPIHNFCCVACLMCFFCCFLFGGVSHSSYRLFLLGCSQNERCVTPCITFLFPVSPSNCSLFLWRWIFLKVSTKSFLSKSLASSCACPHVNLPIFTQVKISIQSRTNTKSYYILYLFSMTYQNKSVSYTIVLPFTVLLSLCRVYASIHWLCVKMYLKVLLPANIKRR